MKRDKRLLVALILFVFSLIAGLVQSVILRLFIDAAVIGNWTHFAKTFSVDAPATGPNVACFDYCAPDLPFIPGWIALAAFSGGAFILAHTWWKPK